MTEKEVSERRRLWLQEQLTAKRMVDRDVALRSRCALSQIRMWLDGSRPISATVLQELAAVASLEPPVDFL